MKNTNKIAEQALRTAVRRDESARRELRGEIEARIRELQGKLEALDRGETPTIYGLGETLRGLSARVEVAEQARMDIQEIVDFGGAS